MGGSEGNPKDQNNNNFQAFTQENLSHRKMKVIQDQHHRIFAPAF